MVGVDDPRSVLGLLCESQRGHGHACANRGQHGKNFAARIRLPLTTRIENLILEESGLPFHCLFLSNSQGFASAGRRNFTIRD
jgi:hypothetical protein